jgi:hypothetical protein
MELCLDDGDKKNKWRERRRTRNDLELKEEGVKDLWSSILRRTL